jgi:hypothetical protein
MVRCEADPDTIRLHRVDERHDERDDRGGGWKVCSGFIVRARNDARLERPASSLHLEAIVWCFGWRGVERFHNFALRLR